MDRSQQVVELRASLAKLADILRNDPKCQWLGHFESCLAKANSLTAGSHSQTQLNELSSSVALVFGGAGSFNDYAPATADATGRISVIPGMEQFNEVAEQVYQNALALRVVGNAL